MRAGLSESAPASNSGSRMFQQKYFAWYKSSDKRNYNLKDKRSMDQFDDLPDVVKKDDKPKFQTEVH